MLYSSDPAWGMRGALKKYYDIHPADFIKRVDREGVWLARTPTTALKHPEKFGIVFHQHSSVKTSTLHYDNASGIYAFLYDQPCRITLPLGTGRKPSGAAVVKRLEEAAANPDDEQHENAVLIRRVAARVSRTARSKYGYYFHIRNQGWRGFTALFEGNFDPDLPYFPEKGMNRLEDWWSNAEADVMGVREGLYSGVYIDSSESFVESINLNREHFKYADLPLVWDANSGKVGVITAQSTYEYLRATADLLHSRGKLFMANYTPIRHGYFATVFDVLGIEVYILPEERELLCAKRLSEQNGEIRLKEVGFTEKELKKTRKTAEQGIEIPYNLHSWRTEDLAYYRRAMCYQKPYNYLIKIAGRKDFALLGMDGLCEYLNWCLFFGIYPGCPEGFVVEQERVEDVFARYTPVMKAIGSAGWEPVTHALSDSPDIRIERFGYGPQDSLHFTVRNFGSKTQETTVAIDAAALKLPQDVEVRDAFTGEFRPSERLDKALKFQLELEPAETVVVKVVKAIFPQ
ncbi:hypothetical protein ACFL1X_09335, partial [Candidatus Hydrogenedentota bacterium]